MVNEIVITILSFATLILGGKLILFKNVVKEVSDIFPALDDVLTEQPGESQQEKIKDLKKLRLECKEAVLAIKKMFKK